MDLRQRFVAAAGSALFLQKGEPNILENYLRKRAWIADEEVQLIEKPGEGNMNFVLRVKTNRQSLIVKQARPWVEKYPQIDAPLERAKVEADFYHLIQENAFLASFTPRLLDWDQDNHIIILEDLGEGADFSTVYQKGTSISLEELEALTSFISHLHHQQYTAAQQAEFPDNQALKRLNHEHIFYFPYLEENGFDLDTVQEGLQKAALNYKKNEGLKSKIAQLGAQYLGTGAILIHGDYYPGSWLRVASGVRIIDPEFGYFGRPEFDLGVMIAHLKMAQTSPDLIEQVLQAYQAPANFNDQMRAAFTGVEILRRIIGLAQLPLDLTLDEKCSLLDEASALVLNF